MLESSLKEALGNRVDLNFSDIKDVSGIFNIETSQSINKKLIKSNFNTALKEFINSRFKEGKKIENVLSKKTKSIEKIARSIQNMEKKILNKSCLLYTSPSPRDPSISRMPSSA